MSNERAHDIVVFGATGFAGRLTAEHLATYAPDGTRIALAGRSRDKLMAVRTDLGPRAADWPLVIADSADEPSLAAMAGSTKVVLTTVGPYLRHGLPLVQACAANGTDYADLTGEVPFVRASIDAVHDAAVASGARIVHACGFDSVPSDLGVLTTAQQALADGAGQLTDTTFVLVSVRGGFSGGTIDSMRVIVDEAKADKRIRALLADPYALSPDRAAEPDLGSERDALGVSRVDGRWTGPFVMASFNTRIVRRSNALLEHGYGSALRYRELMAFGRSPAGPVLAAATAGGVAGIGLGMALPPTRFLLDKVLPAPGEGPSESTRRNGRFHIEITASTTGGARYRTTVRAKGDPGYAATAVMLGQSGLSLALDGAAADRGAGSGADPSAPARSTPARSLGPLPAGVLTPATAMGEALADRLRHHGFTLRTQQL